MSFLIFLLLEGITLNCDSRRVVEAVLKGTTPGAEALELEHYFCDLWLWHPGEFQLVCGFHGTVHFTCYSQHALPGTCWVCAGWNVW